MTLAGRTVAFLVSQEGIEQAELTEPWRAVQQAGGTPKLIAPQHGEVQAYQHLDKAQSYPVDETVDEASADNYAALVLPGGVANGDALRTVPGAVELVKGFTDAGKPVGVICHGGWVLIEADVVRGRQLTSWPTLRTDYRNAGADWVDREVVADFGGYPLISSRKPDDLPAFTRELVAAVEKS